MDATPPHPPAVDSRCITLGLSHCGPEATVIAASTTTTSLWGRPADRVIGRRLSDLVTFDPLSVEEWENLEKYGRIEPQMVHDLDHTEWFLTLTTADGQTMAHLERAPEGDVGAPALRSFAAAVDSVLAAGDEQEMLKRGCAQLRRWTGFDRTFAVVVRADKARVVAESLDAGLPSFDQFIAEAATLGKSGELGRGLPRSVSIFDVDADGARIVPEQDGAGRPWNTLAAPHPHLPEQQRAAIRWCGARSCFVQSLSPEDNDEAYVIVSLSAEPREVAAFTRLSCDILAQLMFGRMASFRRATAMDQKLAQVLLLPDLASRERPLAESLTAKDEDGRHLLLEIVAADGAIIHLDGEAIALGDVAPHEIETITHASDLRTAHLGPRGVTAISDLAQTHPDLSALAPEVGGVLCTSIGPGDSYLCWIRCRQDAVEPVFVGREAAEIPDFRQHRSRRSAPWDEADRRGAEMLAAVVEDWMLRAAETRLAELALTDPLTGLPNRRLLVDRVSQSILRQQRGVRFLLCFIDLNDFKYVNDTDGHQTGDKLLIAIADRLAGRVRPDDTVVRLGGDEFVVLCDGVQPADVDTVKARIVGCFDEPFTVDGQPLRMSAAVGITLATADDTVESLLHRADSEMYTSKSLMKSR